MTRTPARGDAHPGQRALGSAAMNDDDDDDQTTSGWADERAFAIDLSRQAGELLLSHFDRLERIDYKSKRDVVTNADYASERLVIDAIRARFPEDAILAEESGAHAGGRRTWVIDPLDGTVNY